MTRSSPAAISCWAMRKRLRTSREIRAGRPRRLPDLSQAGRGRSAPRAGSGGGSAVNGPNQESIELFLQEASENLQYLREYSGLLQEPQTKPEDLEKLYIASHTLAGTSASYGFPAIFRSCREDGAHLSLRDECRRSLRTCTARSPNFFPTRSPCSNSTCCRSARAARKRPRTSRHSSSATLLLSRRSAAGNGIRSGRRIAGHGRTHSGRFPGRLRSPTACRKMAKFPTKFLNSLFPRPKNICRR